MEVVAVEPGIQVILVESVAVVEVNHGMVFTQEIQEHRIQVAVAEEAGGIVVMLAVQVLLKLNS
jgi:hypothetical protein